MPETNVVSLPAASAAAKLLPQLEHLFVALSESEYHAATIFAFDPDAHLSAGQLAADDHEPRDRPLAGDAMSLRGWIILARACCEAKDQHDDRARLEIFLAERATPVETILKPEIGARVRLRRRPRVGGDRYAGRDGVIVKTHFAGFYVKLDMTPRERSQKTELVETDYLEVLTHPATA
ncbi:KOW domain-containing protein [Novosphingobium lubricantis]|uniref:Uncharacterized protein n=1 Tax=Novosphingobium pentaromativorans US6-1 TaxID=1088721 RepID=G6EJS2_9SPHN|nr:MULTISPECIES: hypothetical protein [Sphingomonadaceae]AIT82588.1 hypothetical protein JI59_24300 [Novosphingobium pentaromativorans US6-1]EHJ58456.1 hypothetical protein NSU_4593 [Novosphingobium pentaromativorans US6-1]KKC26821.1 hypothetical protein WP12_06350 [Sphingomonas sp. SRS2]ODU35452.1 MAG: hypothetical protein ABS88_01090 [Sphingopyxis sp. SCN 67-31]